MSRPISHLRAQRSPWIVPLACGFSVWIAGAVAAVYLLDRESAPIPVAKVICEPPPVVEPPKPVVVVEAPKLQPVVIEVVKPVPTPAREPVVVAKAKPAQENEADSETLKPAMPAPVAVPKQPRQYVTHRLPQRLDHLSTEDLERQLLGVNELALDAPARPGVAAPTAASALTNVARNNVTLRTPYAGPLLLSKLRPELAGLPYHVGVKAVLPRDKAEAMNELSKQLRTTIQNQLQGKPDARLDADKLHDALISAAKDARTEAISKSWTGAEAVPCIQQMLQAESQSVRRMSCELLKDIDVPEATAALVQWAVFDTDAGNRAAAVEALRTRDRNEVSGRLVNYLQYPWPAAVEHTCEALVALGCTEAIPQLQAAASQPDPDAPFTVELPNSAGGTFRRSMVRVSHARNCLLCHPPSFAATDLIRGAIPSESQPLPPAGTPAYYSGSRESITAETTFLQQDFSVVQPVVSPGPWPKHQRFDYFVTIRREKAVAPIRSVTSAVGPANVTSPYRKAIAFALANLKTNDEAIPEATMVNSNLTDAARLISLQTNPAAFSDVKSSKLAMQLDRLTPEEIEKTVIALQKAHGVQAVRLALISLFDEQARTGSESTRAIATPMLAITRGKTIDYDLPGKLARAAKVTVSAAVK